MSTKIGELFDRYRVKKFASYDFGGPDGTRTHGLRVANAALYQLSYEPVSTLYILASLKRFVNRFLTIFFRKCQIYQYQTLGEINMPALVIVLLVLLAAVAILAALICDRTFKITCYHTDEQKSRHNDPHIELSSEQYKDIVPRMHELISEAESMPFEWVEIRSSRDGTVLKGRYYNFSEVNVLNIFFHGYKGTSLRDGCGGFKMAREKKQNILLVDQRANGESGGNVIAFGVNERYDCLDWVNYAVGRFGSDLKILLSGVSLGAATVLMASDVGLPKNVKCIVADCGYSSPKEIICKVAKEGGFPVSICWPLLKLACRFRAGLDLEEASAVESVKHTDIPILIIHGDDDRYVPCEMAHKIYAACASKKELLIIPGAPHAAAFMVDEKMYRDTVDRFTEECLAES